MLVACTAVLAGPISSSAVSNSAPDYAAIDSYASSSLAGTPGFAISIVHGDQVMHAKGFGVADSAGALMTADTPLVIGSESKSFTALAVMQLSESGALILDSPVQRYLPWFRVAQADYSSQITIRQLLNQTSGLPPSAPFDTPVTTVESRVRDLSSVHLIAAPGRLYQYSNSNYDALGQIVETVSGAPYAEYMSQHIFQPLGMIHTFALETEARQNGLGTGHQWWFGLPVSADTYRQDYVPAGWLVSSANDMGRFLIAQLNGGSYRGQSVLSSEGIAAMHHGVTKVSTGGSYGMGWLADTLNGTSVVSHDGDSLNMHTDMILVPSAGWAVEVIANSDSVPVLLSASVESTAKGVVAMLMGWIVPPTFSPAATYAVFDLLMLALVGFQMWSFIRVLSQAPKPLSIGWAPIVRRIVLPFASRLGAAVVLLGSLFMLSLQLGSSVLLIATTDLGVALIALATLLLANGILRVVRMATAKQAINDLPAGGQVDNGIAMLSLPG
jgi:CubicO group peptidase (beta-lactamase class C family)